MAFKIAFLIYEGVAELDFAGSGGQGLSINR